VAKPLKLTDGNGLYIEIRPSGAKLWRYRYRIDGKENVYALGEYPRNKELEGQLGYSTLAEARVERDKARALVKRGIHPAHQKKVEQSRQQAERVNTFRGVASEWLAQHKSNWTEGYCLQIANNLDRHLYPSLGDRPIREIDSAEVLDILRRIEKRGTPTVTMLNKQLVSAIFRYAIATLRANQDPTIALKGAIAAHKVRHHPPLPREELPDLMRKIDMYGGRIETTFAFRLLMQTFLRTGELRQGQWPEIDFESRLWRIPDERMKNRLPHTVPLSTQSINLLENLKEVTGHQRWLFPGYGRDRCISSHTITKALRYMGYEKFSAHGFRSTASTILNEMGFRSDVIERQLSHTDRNSVRSSYNHAQYLPERRKMMQRWSDYLDSVKNNDNVIPINQHN